MPWLVLAMSLLANTEVVGAVADSDPGVVAFFSRSGTVNGTIVLPAPLMSSGSVAVSRLDDRIYVPYQGSGPNVTSVGFFDGDGTTVATVNFTADNVFWVFVPRPGVVWIETTAVSDLHGEIREYDPDGNFIQTVVSLTCSDGGGTIAVNQGMGLFGGDLYFSALRGTDQTLGGVFQADLSTGVCTNVIPYDQSTRTYAPSMSLTPGGEILFHGGTPGGLGVNRVWRYSITGTLLHTYEAPTTPVKFTGIVADPDGVHFWTGANTDDDKQLIRVRIDDDSWVGFNSYIDPYGYASWAAVIPIDLNDCEAVTEYDPDEPTDPVLALLPSPNATKTYDDHYTEVASNAEGGSTSPTIACTLAPSVEDNLWICIDNNGEGGSILREVDPATGDEIRTVVLPDVRIGEIHGRHALYDLGCCKLLTVDRDTHELIEITVGNVDPEFIDEQIGAVSKRYGLVSDPMDFALNSSGTRLIYVDGNALKLWSLKVDEDTGEPEDAYVRTIKTFDDPIIWPLWVADNSIFVFTGDFLGNGDILRIDIDGKLLQTYTYDQSLFAGGLYGIAVAFTGEQCDPEGTGKLILAGVSGFIPAFLGIDLITGASDDIVSEDAIAESVGLFTPSMAGFIAIGEWARGSRSSSDGDATDQGVIEYPTGNAQCGPSTISTVDPNPGCNDGGKGWVPEYVGASGVVPTVDDPIPGETLTGKTAVYVEAVITHTKYEAGGSPETITETQETLRYGLVELDDDERVEGRIRSIGDIEHGMSDANGNIQAATIDLFIMDAEGRPIGSRMDDPELKYFAGDEMLVRVRSHQGRVANGPYRMIGRALLNGESYGTPIVAELSGVDPIFRDGGVFSPDKKVPQWTYPFTFYSNAPPDVSRLFMPIILGEVSDEGADPYSRGKCPLRYMGMDGLGTGAGSPASAEPWGRFNLCLFASYKVIALYGSDLGGLGVFGRSVTAHPSSKASDKNLTTIALDGSPDLSVVPLGGYANLVLFTPTGRSELRIIGKGVSSVTVDSHVDPLLVDGSSWYITRIDHLPRRVKIDLTTRNGANGDCMVPKWPGYIRPTDYEDFIGPEGDYRVTDCWVRGPLLAAHLAGEVTLAANVIGVEDQGDTSGLPITDYFTAFNWFLDNCVHIQQQRPQAPGELWPQTNGEIPLWSDGVPKTRQSTFARCQAITAAALGGSGLQVSAYFGEGISLRDAMQLWLDNGACRLTIDEYGSLGVWMFDPDEDPSTWPLLEHVSRVFADVKWWRAHDEAVNIVQGSCDWDPDGQKYREEMTPIINTPGLRHNKGIPRRSKHIDGKLIARPEQFQWVLERYAMMQADGPAYVTFTGDFGMGDYPVGSGIQFSSPMLPGGSDVTYRLVILSRRFHFSEPKTVNMTCLDVTDLLPAGSPS